MRKITILIADAQLLFRQAFMQMLNSHPLFEVVGSSDSLAGTINLYQQLTPQIVLIDTEMTGVNRFELLKMIRSSESRPKIIAMSSNNYPEYARQIMGIGVMGFITKFASSTELFTAIEEVNAGNYYICREMQDKVVENMFNITPANKMDTLTKKEMDIVSLVKNGYTSKQMAEKLALSAHTIMVHRYKILKKLNLKNAASLVDYIHYNYC